MRAVNVDFLFLNKFLLQKIRDKVVPVFAFTLIAKNLAFSNFLSKKRYNLSSYHLSQTLHVYAISAFKVLSYYCIKVVQEKQKGFFCLYEKYVFSPVLFLCMIFVEAKKQ